MPGTEGALQAIPNHGDQQTGNNQCCPQPELQHGRHGQICASSGVSAHTVLSQSPTGALGLRVCKDNDDAMASMSSYATKVCDHIMIHLTLKHGVSVMDFRPDASVLYDLYFLSKPAILHRFLQLETPCTMQLFSSRASLPSMSTGLAVKNLSHES